MIQNLLPLLPRDLGTPDVVMTGAAVGCAFWLGGTRFSRPLLAMLATVAGGVIGFEAPRWLGWSIDPSAIAVLGALLLGVAGFVAHRALGVVGLAGVLAVWAALASVVCGGWHDQMPTNGILSRAFIQSYLAASNDAPPDTSRQIFLVAAAIGLIGGFTVALIWERLGLVIFWSMLGLTLCILPALSAAEISGQQYLRALDNQPGGEAVALITLIALGAGVQWNLTRPTRPAAAKDAHDETHKDEEPKSHQTVTQ